MQISKVFLRTLSMLGQIGVSGLAIKDLVAKNSDIVALTADLSNPGGLLRLKQEFPTNFYNVGIAEQNMIGIAAGMASGGNIPFATTFSTFACLRACEQVRHFLGYMNENVKIVGYGSGFATGMMGWTHYAVEDIAVVRSLGSNIVILSPSDGLETYKCIELAAQITGPVYIRLSGKMNLPIIYKEDFNLELGKVRVLKEGTDIVVLSTGSMMSAALNLADTLEKEDISVSVINCPCLNPFDYSKLEEITKYKLILTLEEHRVSGGLGSIVNEYYMRKGIKINKFLSLGVEEYIRTAGDYDYLLDVHGLSDNKIYQSVKKCYLS